MSMPPIDRRILDRELKKGSAELIILSILDARARHGYEISKLIESRSNGTLKFHIASLYPLLYRLEERGWLQGRWVEKAGQRRRRFYSLTAAGRRCWPASAARGRPSSRPWVSLPEWTMPEWDADLRARLAGLTPDASARSRDYRGAVAAPRRPLRGAAGLGLERRRCTSHRARGTERNRRARSTDADTGTGARAGTDRPRASE